MVRSTLAGFEARVGFADHVNPAAATNDLTVGMADLGGFQGGYNFHKRFKKLQNQTPVNEIIGKISRARRGALPSGMRPTSI